MFDNKCEEVIKEKFLSREKYIKDILEACANDEPFEGYDDAYDALNNFPLEVQKTTRLKILLSWGGPADSIQALYHPHSKEIIRVEYHFSDWYDHAQMIVESDSPVFEYVEQMIELIES